MHGASCLVRVKEALRWWISTALGPIDRFCMHCGVHYGTEQPARTVQHSQRPHRRPGEAIGRLRADLDGAMGVMWLGNRRKEGQPEGARYEGRCHIFRDPSKKPSKAKHLRRFKRY